MGEEFKKLNLDRNKIIDSINNYCKIHYKKYLCSKEFQEKGPVRRRVNIEVEGIGKFFMDFHFKSDGTTTIDISGEQRELKKQLAKFIKDKCLISKELNKTFSVKGIDLDEFNSIICLIKEDPLYKETLKEEQKDNDIIYKFKGVNQDEVAITRYHTGTVLIQGKSLQLFNQIAIIFSELVDSEEVIEAWNDCYQIKVDKHNVEKQYEIKLPNSYDKHNSKLKKVLLQAVYNTQINLNMFDYSCLVCPALRGLEGHIKYVFKENEILLDSRNIGDAFNHRGDQHILKDVNKQKLNNSYKVGYLENAYTYYFNNRHSLFHWNDLDTPQDDTRIIENYGNAVSIINDTLDIIDSYYR